MRACEVVNGIAVCPFCSRLMVPCENDCVWQVHCLECGARGPEEYTEAEAIQRWNDALT